MLRCKASRFHHLIGKIEAVGDTLANLIQTAFLLTLAQRFIRPVDNRKSGIDQRDLCVILRENNGLIDPALPGPFPTGSCLLSTDTW
jgi:hypothetical protein